ncbi:MAG: hypothetical protein ACRD0U_09220 [Acidimicrobiales bacterium]
MPADAARCPSCGHFPGMSVLLETGPGYSDPGLPVVGGPGPGGGLSRRRDAVVLLVVVALVVLGLAVAARGGGADTAAEEQEETTTTRERRTTTTRRHPPRRTTTSTTRPPGPLLSEPVGLTLATLGSSGLTLVDLDTGAEVARVREADGTIVPVDGGVVVTGAGRAVYVNLATPALHVDLGEAQRVFPSDRADRVWLGSGQADGPYSSSLQVREVDLAGQETAASHDVPGWVVGTAGSGLLVERFGSVFLSERDGDSRLLLHGQLLGAADDRVVYQSCEALDDCSVRVLDVETGDERTIETAEQLSPDQYYFGAFGNLSPISPDGSRLLVYFPSLSGPPTNAMLDLNTGDTVEVPGPSPFESGIGGFSWSPGSDRLFGLTGSGSLWAWKLGAAEVESVLLPPGTVRGDWWGLVVLPSAGI